MKERKYTAVNFLIDALLTVVTQGIWLIWIFIREMRYLSKRNHY